MKEFTILLMIFFIITFLQSALDKILDWKGNVNWLKVHFEKTFLKKHIALSLLNIVALEVITSLLAIYGIIDNIYNDKTEIANLASIFAAITLLFLLLGQRMAKDYDGARTIVIYLIPTLIGVYYL